MSNKLVIEVHQLPPAECSPNSRAHWAARKRAGDIYKEAVYYQALDARNRFDGWQPAEHAEMELEIVFERQRVRDEDNFRARFKPGQDALVQAGVIRSDDAGHLACRPLRFTVDPSRAPLTVITITGIDKR